MDDAHRRVPAIGECPGNMVGSERINMRPREKIATPFLPRWLRAALFAGGLLLTALMTLPLVILTPAPGLDRSYSFGMNYFPNMGYQYGVDLVCTYGPLGYILHPMNVANDIVAGNLIRLVIWLILLIHLVRLQLSGARGLWQSFVLMAALLAAHKQLLGFNFEYLILAALLVVVVYSIERPDGWAGYVCIVSLVGLLSLAKVSAYIMSMATAALWVVARVGWPPKLPPWKDRLVCVALILTAPAAFMVFGAPSLPGFWKYVRASLELSAGYSEAVSLPSHAQDLFYSLVLIGLFSFGLVYAAARRTLPWTSAALLAFLYWTNWKHAFVRSDIHVMISGSYPVLLAACLICLLRGRREIVKYAIGFPCFVLVALSGINVWSPVWSIGYWSPARQVRQAVQFVNLNHTLAELDATLKESDPFRRLPADLQGLVEGSLTTVFPEELSYGATQRFRLDPLYVVQAYMAYTPYLDGMTAERIRGRRGHVDQILFEWQSIDGRHPLLDVPATWRVMFDYYEPRLVADGRMVLVPRKKPLEHRMAFLLRAPAPFGKWVDLPRSESVLWAQIRIPHSVRGRCVAFLYKLPAMWLTAGTESGAEVKFRVIPGMLATAFPINDMPLDFGSLVALWQSRRADARVVRIRLDTEAPDDYRQPSLELSEETGAGMEFAAPETLDSFRQASHFASPDEIPNEAIVYIETINGAAPQPFPDEQHRLAVSADRDLEVDGWTASAPSGVALDAVYATVDGRVVRAAMLERPDVVAHFKNPALELSGFHLNLTSAGLGKGPRKVVLYGVVRATNSWYRIAHPLWLQVY